ncbi:hypothetical protein [Streptomyces lavendulae]|uniref:hypothetical protein n=1 Tax=Streptomyces lavendulae TaxID=1914 RepID=UPI0031E714EE
MTAPTFAIHAEQTAPAPVAQRAAADLLAVREQWGDLLAAISRPPAAEWPPRDSRAFIDGHLADQADEDEHQADEPTIGRMPLVLREHPAPVNLVALDAALDVELALFELADQLAERVQRPVRTSRDEYGRTVRDEEDAADPARWRCVSYRDAGPADAVAHGSRTYGLHWAAVWVEGRLLGEDTGDLFTAPPVRVLDQAAAVARQARQTVERALGRDGRTTTLDDPCPSCGGELTARTQAGEQPAVTCATGEECPAPAPLDRGRRVWRGADLVALYVALDRARSRGEG